ncbi:MAG TPA: hypothetical protein VGM77_03195 [Gemmatimonadales bacterium]|jgi:hypothetical protein
MKRDLNPFRYVRWLARDAMVWPLRVFLLLGALLSLIVWRFATNMHIPRAAPGGASISDSAQAVQLGVWGTCLVVAILMTIGGIAGTDLERGYYRSWFSKPMSAWWYYLQRFLLGAIVIAILPLYLGLGLKLGLGSSTGVTWVLMGQFGLSYLLVASATFLLSIFIARGWLFVFLIAILQNVIEQMVKSGFAPKWLGWMHDALPPFQLLGVSNPLPHGGPLWHILGYGAGMLVAALLLLRYRPLGAGTAA